MAKYVGVQIPLYSGSTATGATLVSYTNSGTTTAATTGKLTDSGSTPNFTANVKVGDYVFATDRTFSKVTAVDSDSILSISGMANATLEGSGVAYK